MPPENKESVSDSVEELGKLQFTIAEVMLITEISEKEFEKHRRRYDKGRLLAAATVRKSILELAEAGNTTAQKQMLELINNATMENEDLDEIK